MARARTHGAGALLAGAAALLFAASLALPVASAQQTHGVTSIMGYELLFIGPFGALNGQFGWFATPCLVVAIHSTISRRPYVGRGGAVGLILVMGMALVDALVWRDYPSDGGPGPIVSYGPGYRLWIAAVVSGAFALIMSLRRHRPAPGSE